MHIHLNEHKFQPDGIAIGNLTIGHGELWGTAARIALVESRIAAGSLGVAECDALARVFTDVAGSGEQLILFLDCAGARVSEGLPALAAFRRMFAAALSLECARVVAYCGTNCFGGGSMLASLARVRVFAADTRFAMSGPAVIAGMIEPDLREVNLAISTAARLNGALGNVSALTQQLAQTPRHIRLSTFFSAPEIATARLRIPPTHDLHLDDAAPMGALRAWVLADEIWALCAAPPARLRLFVDSPSHAASLADERQFLSAQIVNLAEAMHALRLAGTLIETIVTGTLGGGVYVALAAASTKVLLGYGAEIRLLPGKAIESILGENRETKNSLAAYLAAGVADQKWESTS